MLKPRNSEIQAVTNQNISSGMVRIRAGSFIIDNKWVNFNGTTFKVNDYINKVVRAPRVSFFKNRNHAIYLLVGLDADLGVQVVEGTSIRFTTVEAVPPPSSFNILPLVGIVLVQDGSRDLNLGYRPILDVNVRYFSGAGNVVNKNIKGDKGSSNPLPGATGVFGETGVIGQPGLTGYAGATGYVGYTPPLVTGNTGIGGLTGISWDVDIPYEEFF